MYKEVIIFIVACLALVKSAEYAVKSVEHIARFFRLTEFVTSFLLVAFVSAMPEGFISVISALKGDPSIGVGTLLGGNIADLTLILGLVTLAGHPVKIHSSIIKKDLYFAILMLLPILLGLNGVISRLDGLILLTAGTSFLIVLLKEKQYFHKPFQMKDHWIKHFIIFSVCIALMLLSAHFIVQSSHSLAISIGIPSILIGLVLVALGTTLPEFIFSLQSVRAGHGDMAVGDLLGVVVVDACIMMGIISLISPITVNLLTLSIVGIFTFFAVLFALLFMRTDGMLTKNEAMAMVFFYIAFVVVQILMR
ncbi:Sodium/calcium exchanger MaX1 [uncultured archaeon]|nr:Sodium/calcium exchanger MaX1 [uncultured archaeon]